MKISLETPEKLVGKLTMVVEEADYQPKVDAALKNYRKKANVPGFRPGQAPMGLIKRQVGAQVKMEELNKMIGEELYKYIGENKINMLGEPMPNEAQEPQDLEKDGDLTFIFDIAIAPELDAKLTSKDKIDYTEIEIDDELVNRQIEMFSQRHGEYKQQESYQDGNMMKGDLRQLDAEGNTLEGGLTLDSAMLMPKFIKVDEQKNLFNDAKVGDIITWNPRKAYPENDAEMASLLKVKKEEVGQYTCDFSFQVTEITRYAAADVNQKLFDAVYGEGTCKDESEFRAKIKEGLSQQLASDQDYGFLNNVREYLEKRNGEVAYPDLMKRIMRANAEDKSDEYIEKNYEPSLKALTWQLLKNQLVSDLEIKVEKEDLEAVAVEAARVQFAQYGMNSVPEEYLKDYASKMMEDKQAQQGIVDRAIDVKLIEKIKTVVKLNNKKMTLDEFNKQQEA